MRLRKFVGDIILFLCVGCTTFLLMCIASYSQNLTHIFVDREYGYSIRYPDGWSARLYRSGVVLSEVNSKDGRSGLQIRRIYRKGYTDDFTIDDFIESYIEDFKQDMRASLISKNKKVIGNISGWVLTFKGKRGSTKYLLKSYLLPTPGGYHIYIFQAGTPMYIREKIEPILDSIADSFRLE